MRITINEQFKGGETDVYKTFYFDKEHGRFDDKYEKFSHVIWDELIKQEHGEDFFYIPNYKAWMEAYDEDGYKGEGIYQNTKLIMDVDTLREGISSIQLDDYLYFI